MQLIRSPRYSAPYRAQNIRAILMALVRQVSMCWGDFDFDSRGQVEGEVYLSNSLGAHATKSDSHRTCSSSLSRPPQDKHAAPIHNRLVNHVGILYASNNGQGRSFNDFRCCARAFPVIPGPRATRRLSKNLATYA